ncbi:unnamed protein product, partial [Polarella glacialis]
MLVTLRIEFHGFQMEQEFQAGRADQHDDVVSSVAAMMLTCSSCMSMTRSKEACRLLAKLRSLVAAAKRSEEEKMELTQQQQEPQQQTNLGSRAAKMSLLPLGERHFQQRRHSLGAAPSHREQPLHKSRALRTTSWSQPSWMELMGKDVISEMADSQ